MKKILLLMVLLGVYVGSIWGQKFKLVGPIKGSINSQSEYVVYFLERPTKIYQLGIKVTGGAPDRPSIGTLIGTYNYSFKVNWSQVTNNAKVEVSLREAISNKPLGPEAAISKIVITNTPTNPEYDTSITGPDKLYVLETARYDFKIQGNQGYLSWDNLLEDVLYIKPSNPTLDERYRMVTVLAPTVKYDEAGLTCTATELNVKLGMAYKIIKIIKPQITTSTNIVCANQNITFTLKDHYPSATIKWQATNMTLVSGQGTANAVFKATGNGYANVKAILTYGGRSYTVENSSVWVGLSQIQSDYPEWYKYKAGQMISLRLPKGADKNNAVWNVSFKKGSSTLNVDQFGNLSFRAPSEYYTWTFTVSLRLKNPCTSAYETKYYEAYIEGPVPPGSNPGDGPSFPGEGGLK